MPQTPTDPYAPPPRHKDKSGVVVRVAILSAIIAAATGAYIAAAPHIEQASRQPLGAERTFAESDQAFVARDSSFDDPAPATQDSTMTAEPAQANIAAPPLAPMIQPTPTEPILTPDQLN